MKRTKIIGTLGPASDNETVLLQLIAAGLNVVRINFSHAKHAALVETVARVRQAAEQSGKPIAILGDLRGPRIRVGDVAGGSIPLQTGAQIILTPEPVIGTPERVSVSFAGLAGDVQPGSPLLLDDGNLILQALEILPGGEVRCEVKFGGILSSKRGVNLPGTRVSLPSLTDKDFADIDFAIAQDFDFLALSFVQSAHDVRSLQTHLAARGADIPVIAKIETQSALDDIEAIAATAYGVMVARGDLALEMSLSAVPIAQKLIITACRRAAKPVITATQMLESMTHAPKPTRAEATDIANAIFDGTDALMLSGESAMGDYPVQAVATMTVIAERAEAAWLGGELPAPPALTAAHGELEPVVALAAGQIAAALQARAIVTHTTSGSTTRRVACHRPAMSLLALCTDERIRRRLALTWGVESVVTGEIESTAHMVDLALDASTRLAGAQPGEAIVIVAGTPYHVSGRTNLIKVEQVPAAGERAAKI